MFVKEFKGTFSSVFIDCEICKGIKIIHAVATIFALFAPKQFSEHSLLPNVALKTKSDRSLVVLSHSRFHFLPEH